MEHISFEGPKPYIPYERRMLLDHLGKTYSQPILCLRRTQDYPDTLDVAGINHGLPSYPADEVFIRRLEDGEIGKFPLDGQGEGYFYVAGHEEVSAYLVSQLTGWRVDARDPAKIEQVVRLVDSARRLEVVVDGLDLNLEAQRAWEAVCDLTAEDCHDSQKTLDMLFAVHDSELNNQLEILMQTILQKLDSLHEIHNHPLLMAYLELLAGTHISLAEQMQIVQQLVHGTGTLEK